MRKKHVATLTLIGALFTLPFAFTALDEAQGSGISARVPAEYASDVLRAGAICQEVSPALIAAQIDVESGWNPRAQSSAGAMGISQFMPQTWAAVGKDGDGDGKADIMNPHDAILTQGHYMCDHITRAQTDIKAGTLSGNPTDLALAAYNAGYGAVSTARGVPGYGETRAYVKKIRALIPLYQGNASASASGKEGAVEWAKSIAADDSHTYVWAGVGPHYDCSGLTQAAFRLIGIELPHKAHLQAQNGKTIDGLDQAQAGDLLFWGTPANYWHVAIYAGGGMMVSADSPAAGINFEPIWGTVTLIKRY